MTLTAAGRGTYKRTRLTADGFPRGYLMRQKQVQGFRTGDLVRAAVSTGKKTGIHLGRVAVRASGSFNIQTAAGVVQGIHHRHCRRLQRGDGYGYHQQPAVTSSTTTYRETRFPPNPLKGTGYPARILMNRATNTPVGIPERYQPTFATIRDLLLVPGDPARAEWCDDTLDRTFVDVLTAGGGTTYKDGRTAFLGAYSSRLDYEVLKEVCALFTDPELARIVSIYRANHYLSPIFGLLASWTAMIVERRNKEPATCALSA